MIDPTQIPLLVKILDFLFGEGSKILQERRERRQAQLGNQEMNDEPSTPQKSENHALVISESEQLATKDSVLSEQLDEARWSDVEGEIKHLGSLLDIHLRNYRLAKEKHAKWGSSLVPPIVMNDLIDAEDELVRTMFELQNALNRAYEKQILIDSAE